MRKCSVPSDQSVVNPLINTPSHDKTPRASFPCLYRLKQVLERIPVSKSSWFQGIKAGRYPRGMSLGPRTTVWRSEDIDRFINSLDMQA